MCFLLYIKRIYFTMFYLITYILWYGAYTFLRLLRIRHLVVLFIFCVLLSAIRPILVGINHHWSGLLSFSCFWRQSMLWLFRWRIQIWWLLWMKTTWLVLLLTRAPAVVSIFLGRLCSDYLGVLCNRSSHEAWFFLLFLLIVETWTLLLAHYYFDCFRMFIIIIKFI